MKIAVSAKGRELNSPMDPRFGRCEGFVLHDTEGVNTVFLDNDSQRNLSQGSGIQAAQMIAEAGAQVLITGQLGPKAAQVLSKAGIEIYTSSSGTVQEAIDALKLNKLDAFDQDNIQPGPGKMGGRGMGGGGRGRKGGVSNI
jgi:predicted Fe-Mo cluster-binding NifX family protein